MSVELVTGHANEKHVSARDAAAYNAYTIYDGDAVLEGGQRFKATIVNATTITIGTGEMMMQGRHITSMQPTTLALAPGMANTRRIDRIVMTYTIDNMGIEKAELRVVRGTSVAASATPTKPGINQGNLWNNATRRDVPMYSIQINGITPATPVQEWNPMPSLHTVYTRVSDAQTNIGKLWSYANLINTRVENNKNSATSLERAQAELITQLNDTRQRLDAVEAKFNTLDGQLSYAPVYGQIGLNWKVQHWYAVTLGKMLFITASFQRTNKILKLAKAWDSEVLVELSPNIPQGGSLGAGNLTPNPMHVIALANNMSTQTYFIRATGNTLVLRDHKGGQQLNVGGWLQFTAIFHTA